jgi:hypothetical protein
MVKLVVPEEIVKPLQRLVKCRSRAEALSYGLKRQHVLDLQAHAYEPIVGQPRLRDVAVAKILGVTARTAVNFT